jgi:hypothetical protein
MIIICCLLSCDILEIPYMWDSLLCLSLFLVYFFSLPIHLVHIYQTSDYNVEVSSGRRGAHQPHHIFFDKTSVGLNLSNCGVVRISDSYV